VALRKGIAAIVAGSVRQADQAGAARLLYCLVPTLARPRYDPANMHSGSDMGSRLERFPVDTLLEGGGGAVDRLLAKGFRD
jgi:hypothetical protein